MIVLPSIVEIDLELRAALLALDDQRLAQAFADVSSGIRGNVPDPRGRVEAWQSEVRIAAPDLLAAVDMPAATRLADRLLGTAEIRALQWGQTELIERKHRTHAVLLRGLHTLSVDELVDSLIEGRLYVEWTARWEEARFRFLLDLPALSTPEAIFRALQRLIARWGWAGYEGCASFLAERLALDAYPPGAPWLLEAWNANRSAPLEAHLAEAVIAAGDLDGIAAIAATFGIPQPSRAAAEAVLCLDPGAAVERLGPYFDVAKLDDQERLFEAQRILTALAQDGLRAGQIGGLLSRRPRGWVRADERWIPVLFALRSHPEDPDIAKSARAALDHADPSIAAKYTHAFREPKKLPKATLVRLGEATFADYQFWGVPLWCSAERIVFPIAEQRLAVHCLSAGFARESEIALPEDLWIPLERRSADEDGWDREGVHAAAQHPARPLLALGGVGGAGPAVLLIGLDGQVLARREIAGEWPRSLVFDGTGRTLWVAYATDEGHHVAALDAETLEPAGGCSLVTDFPPPAFFAAHAHPTTDAGYFEVACGQDGVWLKHFEHAEDVREVPHELSGSTLGYPLLGFSSDGTIAVTALDTEIQLRDWPTMKVIGSTALGGSGLGGGASGDRVIVPIAEVGSKATTFGVFRLPDGRRLATGAWPKGETFHAVAGNVVITYRASRLSAWALSIPSVSAPKHPRTPSSADASPRRRARTANRR